MGDLHYQHQTIYGDDPRPGDCARAAVASMLGIPIESVPHFFEDHSEKEEYDQEKVDQANDHIQEFVAGHGYRVVKLLYHGENTPPEQIMQAIEDLNPGLRYLLIGESKRGTNHVVICRGGEIDHDPSPNKTGIVGPCIDSGYYWVEIFAPLRFFSLG